MEYLIGKTAHTGYSIPKEDYDATQISDLEKAILSFTEVKFKYRSQKGNSALICYRLDLIENLETTTQAFTPKDGWNLKEWSEQ